MIAVLHRDPSHVLLRHAVFVHVAHGGHRQHVNRAQRQLAFVCRVPYLVQHGLAVATLTNLIGARRQHGVADARRDMVIGRRHTGNAGGAAGVDAQKALVARAHGIHAQPFGITDAHHRVRRQRIDNGIDLIEVQAAIGHRRHDRLPHEIRIAGIVALGAEGRLADTDDTNARCVHAALPMLSRSSTITVLYCIAKPLAAWATPRRAFARWCGPARPRNWFTTSAMRISPVQ